MPIIIGKKGLLTELAGVASDFPDTAHLSLIKASLDSQCSSAIELQTPFPLPVHSLVPPRGLGRLLDAIHHVGVPPHAVGKDGPSLSLLFQDTNVYIVLSFGETLISPGHMRSWGVQHCAWPTEYFSLARMEGRMS